MKKRINFRNMLVSILLLNHFVFNDPIFPKHYLRAQGTNKIKKMAQKNKKTATM